MLLLLIGTLAPGSPTGWWAKLVANEHGDPGVYIQKHQAAVDTDGEVSELVEMGYGQAVQSAGGLQPSPCAEAQERTDEGANATTTPGGSFSQFPSQPSNPVDLSFELGDG